MHEHDGRRSFSQWWPLSDAHSLIHLLDNSLARHRDQMMFVFMYSICVPVSRKEESSSDRRGKRAEAKESRFHNGLEAQ